MQEGSVQVTPLLTPSPHKVTIPHSCLYTSSPFTNTIIYGRCRVQVQYGGIQVHSSSEDALLEHPSGPVPRHHRSIISLIISFQGKFFQNISIRPVCYPSTTINDPLNQLQHRPTQLGPPTPHDAQWIHQFFEPVPPENPQQSSNDK